MCLTIEKRINQKMRAFEFDTTLKTGDDYFQSSSNIDKRFPLYAQICLLRSG